MLKLAIILLITTINVTSTVTAASSSTASYTSGITEEKCAMEEEFHGASGISLGAKEEHAWWDDDDSEEYPNRSNHVGIQKMYHVKLQQENIDGEYGGTRKLKQIH